MNTQLNPACVIQLLAIENALPLSKILGSILTALHATKWPSALQSLHVRNATENIILFCAMPLPQAISCHLNLTATSSGTWYYTTTRSHTSSASSKLIKVGGLLFHSRVNNSDWNEQTSNNFSYHLSIFILKLLINVSMSVKGSSCILIVNMVGGTLSFDNFSRMWHMSTDFP